ncbi:hypothetical protein G6F46_014060 [Rhizopus delemar]|nr:hypothetical protein G6F46_014060 [Rhizopus delemar]
MALSCAVPRRYCGWRPGLGSRRHTRSTRNDGGGNAIAGRSAGGRPCAGPERLHRRAVWLHAAGGSGGGRHQGGTAQRRQPAQVPVHAGCRKPRLSWREPRQAWIGAGPEKPGSAGRPARSGAAGGRAGAQLPAQRAGPAGHRL